MRIRKEDNVYVIAGKDKGKSGRVIRVFPKAQRATVEGVNIVKKHTRRSQENQQGGVIQVERPIHISNLKLFCKQCNRAVRNTFIFDKEGKKQRICKLCKEVL
ncbi:MAG: 50S ribosomal protein L24 [Candidatus Omnitrophota bacterium]